MPIEVLLSGKPKGFEPAVTCSTYVLTYHDRFLEGMCDGGNRCVLSELRASEGKEEIIPLGLFDPMRDEKTIYDPFGSQRLLSLTPLTEENKAYYVPRIRRLLDVGIRPTVFVLRISDVH